MLLARLGVLFPSDSYHHTRTYTSPLWGKDKDVKETSALDTDTRERTTGLPHIKL